LMSESAPSYDPQEELRKLLAGAGLYGQQIKQLQPRLQMGQQMMQPQVAQGSHVGNTYVAASPWEHLSNAIRQIVGGKIAGDAERQQEELTQGLGNARQQYMGALQTAQSGGQGAPEMLARPPDPQEAQRLEMMGVASGDPSMAATGHFGLQSRHADLQSAQLKNTLRHQMELEGQGRDRLGISQEKVEQMNRSLISRNIRYNPNTGEFEDVTPKGAKLPKKSSVLPKSTSLAAPPDASSDAAPASPAPAPAAGQLGKWQDKALKELGADFNPSSGRSGEFGKNQARVNSAKRLMALAEDEAGNARDLTPQQMPELSQSLAGLIGGSAGAQAQIEHLTPHSISGDTAKIAQWITNEPHGAGQQAFVKQMIETAKRERDTAQQSIDQVRGQLGAKHQRILRSNPVEAGNLLKGFGWEIGPDGMPVQIQAQPDGAAALRKKYGL
jgi:hypothetical protein